MAKRYLKNNGESSNITLSTQPEINYLDRNGDEFKIEIVMLREGGGNEAAEKMGLSEDEKCLVYYKNGDYKKKTIITAWKTIDIKNYPHVLGIAFGKTKYDERKYNIKVGETVEISNSDDAELILQQIHFVDEVDRKGNILDKGNPYNKADNRPVTGKPIGNLPKIDVGEFKPTSPREKRAEFKMGD